MIPYDEEGVRQRFLDTLELIKYSTKQHSEITIAIHIGAAKNVFTEIREKRLTPSTKIIWLLDAHYPELVSLNQIYRGFTPARQKLIQLLKKRIADRASQRRVHRS